MSLNRVPGDDIQLVTILDSTASLPPPRVGSCTPWWRQQRSPPRGGSQDAGGAGRDVLHTRQVTAEGGGAREGGGVARGGGPKGWTGRVGEIVVRYVSGCQMSLKCHECSAVPSFM